MLCHVDVLILLCFVLTCCADCGVSERPAAYPFLCYCLHGRLVVLAPFLCVVPLSIVSEALHLPLHAHVKQSRAYWFLMAGGSEDSWLSGLASSVAAADVRVRVRGRIVSVHRQRGQVRVVSVVAAPEATDRPYSAAALSFCERTQPHQLAATPIRLPHLAASLDSCFVDAGPHLYTWR